MGYSIGPSDRIYVKNMNLQKTWAKNLAVSMVKSFLITKSNWQQMTARLP